MISHSSIYRPASLALCVAAICLAAGCSSSAKTTASVEASASVGASAAAPSVPAATTSAASTSDASAATDSTGGATSAPVASAVDPCNLLTAAQVSAATGGTVSDGKSEAATGPLGGKKCNWSNDGSPVIDFELTLQTDADITVPGQTVDSLFDETTSTFPGLTAAAGIGTKAFFGKTQGYVLVGNYLVTTVADIGGTADSSAINKTLTATAIAKL